MEVKMTLSEKLWTRSRETVELFVEKDFAEMAKEAELLEKIAAAWCKCGDSCNGEGALCSNCAMDLQNQFDEAKTELLDCESQPPSHRENKLLRQNHVMSKSAVRFMRLAKREAYKEIAAILCRKFEVSSELIQEMRDNFAKLSQETLFEESDPINETQ